MNKVNGKILVNIKIYFLLLSSLYFVFTMDDTSEKDENDKFVKIKHFLKQKRTKISKNQTHICKTNFNLFGLTVGLIGVLPLMPNNKENFVLKMNHLPDLSNIEINTLYGTVVLGLAITNVVLALRSVDIQRQIKLLDKDIREL